MKELLAQIREIILGLFSLFDYFYALLESAFVNNNEVFYRIS